MMMTVALHVVLVLSRVVRAKCENFGENEALFRDFKIEKHKKKRKKIPRPHFQKMFLLLQLFVAPHKKKFSKFHFYWKK